jgi:hypothetical protein
MVLIFFASLLEKYFSSFCLLPRGNTNFGDFTERHSRIFCSFGCWGIQDAACDYVKCSAIFSWKIQIIFEEGYGITFKITGGYLNAATTI